MDQIKSSAGSEISFERIENGVRAMFTADDLMVLSELYSQETLERWTLRLTTHLNSVITSLTFLMAEGEKKNPKVMTTLQTRSFSLYCKTFEYFIFVLNGGDLERSIQRMKVSWTGVHPIQQPTLVRQLRYAIGLVCIDDPAYLSALIDGFDRLQNEYPQIRIFNNFQNKSLLT